MNRRFLLLIGSIFLIYSCNGTDEFDTLFSVELLEQTTVDRDYLPIQNTDHKLQYSEFIDPQRLLVTENEFIVFDFGNEYKALRFDWDFRLLNEIDFSSGQGPSEIGQLTDVELIADTLYLADASNALIHAYDVEGNSIRSLSIDEKIPHRIVSTGDHGLFVATPLTPENGLERIYSLDGRLTHTVERVSSDDVRYRILLESEYSSNQDYVFRAPQFFGLLIAYDNAGTVVRAMKTIDGFSTPFDDQMSGSTDQPLMFERSALGMATLRVKATDELVCTLIIKQIGDPGRERVTDCYSAEDLEYQFSLETPDGTQDFGLMDKYFITLQDTTVTVIEFLQE